LAEEKTISSRRLFEGRAINVRIDTVITVDGRESTREIVEHSPCVAVIAVDTNGDILLVRQFRKAIEKELLEIPAGGIDPGEDPETAVKRECQEEIGYLPGRVERLGGYYSSPGFSTEYLYLYLASELKPSRLFAEDTPGIETVRVKPQQVLRMIKSAEICDSKSVAGLLYYLDLASQGEALERK
jgi:ADP-ribose pyrophosphatase